MSALASDLVRMLQTAGVAQQQGRTAEASRLYSQVIARDPANATALNALGMLALNRGEPQAAQPYFERAAVADPSSPRLLLNVAAAARMAADDGAEEAALRRALQIDQRLLMAHLRLAELHERRGETAQAWRHWGSVLAAARMMEPQPPELAPVVARAQAYVDAQSALFGKAMDEGLAPARDGLSAAERRRFDTALDAVLGRRRIFRNECQGMHFPFLPADEYFDRAHFPWIDALEAQAPVIRGELEALLATRAGAFTPYVAMERGTPENVWTKLDHSLDWSAVHLWRHGVRDGAVCAECPQTAAALQALPRADMPRRSPTAFFSVLKPRTHIPPHGGVTNVRSTAHLALVVPEGCRFRVGGEMRAWREGECFVFDDTIEHEAWNDSDRMRAVLIFDVWNPHLSDVEQGLIRAFFAAADASDHNPGMDTH